MRDLSDIRTFYFLFKQCNEKSTSTVKKYKDVLIPNYCFFYTVQILGEQVALWSCADHFLTTDTPSFCRQVMWNIRTMTAVAYIHCKNWLPHCVKYVSGTSPALISLSLCTECNISVEGSVASSQLQSPQLQHQIVSPGLSWAQVSVCVEFHILSCLLVSSSLSKTWSIDYTKLPLGVNVCVNVCAYGAGK